MYTGTRVNTCTREKDRMKPSEALQRHRETIRRVIASHHAGNARVFGSVLTGKDTDGGDLDLLIDPTPETTLFDIGAIRAELRRLLGVPVDVLTPKALPEQMRAAVLAQARPV
jgi:predicted nucleotidyltransferase